VDFMPLDLAMGRVGVELACCEWPVPSAIHAAPHGVGPICIDTPCAVDVAEPVVLFAMIRPPMPQSGQVVTISRLDIRHARA
jgi:hypothetical protein